MVGERRERGSMNSLPEKTRAAQAAASDPKVSAWVAAHAGSGKTTVLVRRAIRLMLASVPPARILCLTYTKAAAAHMANEVLRTLAEWVRLDDTALDEKLAEVDPTPASASRRERARRLFAAALETPGGLRVQTIHAFCDRVLHQFPFEAEVPAGFEVLDEIGEQDLLARARLSVLLEATRDREGTLGRTLSLAVAAASDRRLEEGLNEAVRERRKLQRFLEGARGGTARAIAAALGLEADDTLAAIEAEILGGPNLPHKKWAATAATLRGFGGNAAARGEALALAAGMTDATEAVSAYLPVFLNKDNEPRADGQFGSEGARRREPALFDRLLAERERLIPLLERRAAASAAARSAALLTLAAAVIRRYEHEKAERGLLDFGDLVARTDRLLSDPGSAWVHYKLDGGIDHILIDEAQDTSPEQWAVIEKLATEFFAGRGAREDRRRTIFAVGDEKQSIFSFQGAAPAQFEEMRVRLRQQASQIEMEFRDVMLDLSFRSAPNVLKAIDSVFEREIAVKGLSVAAYQKHTAIRTRAPALVEVWPLVGPDPKLESDELPWDAPLDAQSEKSPLVVLAQRIASAVKSWISDGLAVTDRRSMETRGAEAGDIIVLVRRRGPLFEAILRALKSEGIPVAGADRLDLAGHIAVMDLLAFADALLLKHDDLALATALKSPLFDLSEDDLFRLAHGRSATLEDALIEKAADDPRFKEAAEKLQLWRKEAGKLRPFDFLSRVLGRDGGRARILGRLGIEAADAIDELLARALTYETSEAPSLAGFAAFLRRSGAEVKRDLEIESAAVRVMTVHGVKGLEAPIIVVADTTSVPDDGHHDPELLELPLPKAEAAAPIWALGSKLDSAKLAAAREAARKKREEEYKRLLYVALTRAADALIVCGCDGKRQDVSELPENCWYRLVHEALKPELQERAAPGFDGTVWRWRPEAALKAAKVVRTAAAIKLPDWLKHLVPAAEPPPEQLAPSAAVGGISVLRAASAAEGALRRGELIHALLQILPGTAPAERETGALRYLSSVADDLAEDERAKLAAEAMAVVNHADCAMLFGENSRAEVSIFARLRIGGAPREISGRIDRLVAAADAVHIADFKSDRNPPTEPPEPYVAQLALYREAVARLYPGKPIRAHLVWTAKPFVQEISASALDAAFQQVIHNRRMP
jgi:ATP-dependent helicase/nuclease subunit A